jgi:LasA protease
MIEMKPGFFITILSLSLFMAGCFRIRSLTTHPDGEDIVNPNLEEGSSSQVHDPSRDPSGPMISPSPDDPHPIPTLRTTGTEYTVKYGDSLEVIAMTFGVDVNALIAANQPMDANILEVGRVLSIPVPSPLPTGPAIKIIPDSELVYGPASAGFDFPALIKLANGYLSHYSEIVDGELINGSGILDRVSRENSVNPRVLLAVLEYTSGWLTQSSPQAETLEYPIRYYDPNHKGLYFQLSFAANELNRGYYLHKINALSYWVLADGSVVPLSLEINSGTAGVQNLMGYLYGYSGWLDAIGDKGVLATYQMIFGNPFDFSIEPLVPADLEQPAMQLPFETNAVWSFTSGPHGGWADGSAWAALDFAPPGDALGCVLSDEWIVATTDGMITQAKNGLVIQDLDGDGQEQTGWSIIYMHVESRDRVPEGTFVESGERIGHPSCEGGFSNGTHVHIARRYNGEWISADSSLPFNLDGWISQGNGIEYDGFLIKDGVTVEAWDARLPENQIQR